MPAAGGQSQTETALALDHGRMRQEIGMLCVRGQTDRVLDVLAAAPKEAGAALPLALDEDGTTALHLAVLGGHLRLLQELVARGCDVNVADAQGSTPLQVACAESHADVVLELLLARADANAVDEGQQTALHHAVAQGASAEVLRLLLDTGGADPAPSDATSTTPLLLAAARGRSDQLACLLAKDPGLVTATNAEGWTALHFASHGMETKRYSASPASFPAAVKLLLEAKAEPDAMDEDRKTALHRAATSGNTAVAAALLGAGASATAEDSCRWTPLHHACQDGHMDVAKLLLKAKAEVQRHDLPCLTPLALATLENHVKLAVFLVNQRADPNLHGYGLASPITIARKDKARLNDLLAFFEIGFVQH